MREIKFRGYSKVELTTPTQWVVDGYGVTTIEYTNDTESTHLITPYGDYLVDKESVGQYTGLKDKNEKEIYEGDIVKISGMCEAIGVVVFNDCEFCIEQKIWYSKKPIYRSLKVKGNYDDGKCSFDFKQTFEVIGDIYQNKDLLETE